MTSSQEDAALVFAFSAKLMVRKMRGRFSDDAYLAMLDSTEGWGDIAAWEQTVGPCRASISKRDAAELDRLLVPQTGFASKAVLSRYLVDESIEDAAKDVIWTYIDKLDRIATGTDTTVKALADSIRNRSVAPAAVPVSAPVTAPGGLPQVNQIAALLSDKQKQTEIASTIKTFAPQMIQLFSGMMQQSNGKKVKSDNPIVQALQEFTDAENPTGMVARAMMSEAKEAVIGGGADDILSRESESSVMSEIAALSLRFDRMEKMIEALCKEKKKSHK